MQYGKKHGEREWGEGEREKDDVKVFITKRRLTFETMHKFVTTERTKHILQMRTSKIAIKHIDIQFFIGSKFLRT